MVIYLVLTVIIVVSYILWNFEITFEMEDKEKRKITIEELRELVLNTDQHPLFVDLVNFHQTSRKRMPIGLDELELLRERNFVGISSIQARLLSGYLNIYLFDFLKKYGFSEDLIE